MLGKPNNYLIEKLQALIEEHSKILELMRAEEERAMPDELAIHKMKKQRLRLKDQIDEVRSSLHPDIIA